MVRGKKSAGTAALILILLFGLGLLLYPSVSNYWNSVHQSKAINNYTKLVEELDPDTAEQMLEAAHAYNLELADPETLFAFTEEGNHKEYLSLLDFEGDGIMGYIEIKKINVSIPIAHTVEEGILQKYVGHLEGSSLPVGGTGTHAVLSGHRGLPSARLFTDLANLEEGDRFVLSVLNETLTYEVDQIRIVLPDDTTDLAINPNEDYCTLVTCTPYGINTHRMLVRGHRVENEKVSSVVVADGAQVDPVAVAPFIGVPLVIVFLGISLWRRGW